MSSTWKRAMHSLIPPERLKIFHTMDLGGLIHSFIVNSRSESYLELGSGHGSVLLMAGLALKQVTPDYRLAGIDRRENRVIHARKMLDDMGITHDIRLADANSEKIVGDFDVLTVDCGQNENQKFIDMYVGNVRKAIFVHDVDRELVFPAGWVKVPFPFSKSLMAVRGS